MSCDLSPLRHPLGLFMLVINNAEITVLDDKI